VPSALDMPERPLFLLAVIPAVRIAEQRPIGDIIIVVIAKATCFQPMHAARMPYDCFSELCDVPPGAVGYLAWHMLAGIV